MNENLITGIFQSIENSKGIVGLILVFVVAFFLKFLINLIPSANTKKRKK